jgi:hypothetical protein
VGYYTHTEHEACIASLQNNGHLNRVLKLVGVAYEPRPVPVSTEVFKKRMLLGRFWPSIRSAKEEGDRAYEGHCSACEGWSEMIIKCGYHTPRNCFYSRGTHYT